MKLGWAGGVGSCCRLSHAPPHRQAGHHELAERLVECQYELTDRLAFYLCGRKPGEQSSGLAWLYQAGGTQTHPSSRCHGDKASWGTALLGNWLL